MAIDLETLFSSEKMLAAEPVWGERDGELLEVFCPLEIDGIVIEGLNFRAVARKRLPDELVTVQLEYHPPNERGGPLARIEWKPLRGHNNRGRGPKEFQNRLISGCHCHPFDLNWKYARKELTEAGNLPIAVPLTRSPRNFDALLEFVKEDFRITNIEWIEVPPWEPTLV